VTNSPMEGKFGFARKPNCPGESGPQRFMFVRKRTEGKETQSPDLAEFPGGGYFWGWRLSLGKKTGRREIVCYPLEGGKKGGKRPVFSY